MKTYKTILTIYILLFVIGISIVEFNSIIVALLASPFIGIYSIVMFLLGHRSWYLLLGLLASILGMMFFFLFLTAFAVIV